MSAVVMEGEVEGGEESEAIEESDEGDLLLLRRCTGRGAGTGGLEASAPWGRSITRSGVCFGFRLVAGVEVRDSQNPRRPWGPPARGASSSLVGVEVVRRSHRSRFRRKLPLPSSRWSNPPCLLPQLVCFKTTPSSPVFPCSPLLDLGVTAGVLFLAPSSADTLRDEAVEEEVEEKAAASTKSCLPTPSREPAGRLASSSTSGLVCCSTTSSTTALTSARAEASSVRSSWLLPVLARLSCELLLFSTSSSSPLSSSLTFSASSPVTCRTLITHYF